MTSSLFRATHDEKRAKLSLHFVEAVEPMLNEATYSELKVEEIIKAGGISRTTFYVYFTDKVDLLRAMVETMLGEFHAVAFWRLPDNINKEELRDGLRLVVATYRHHRLLLRALVEGAGYDGGLREIYDAFVGQGIVNATNHIKQGQAVGTVDPSLEPEGTARLLVWMGERALYQMIGVEGREDDQDLLEPLADIFWRTLYEGYR
jgi:AcrR family transcriptional regulator